ncbi:ParB/Srx family N-terminal domain-containing protein [Erythrobacter donghaensis]|jgi:ParB-like chromosome segregation protein Spo0J|uniref:ParB/Srx family N-terminal domain-containing protein n=1 Tax=Erythrobacter donghaensis TaxID=267135 RepID=UPI00093FB881|nr:ParB/Srx family N-terminal domain-containing protein [Erythrobacter donghaensis]
MGKVKTEQFDIAVDALLLDEENPRLGSATNQSETLRKLVELNPNHFRNLMLSIKENGLDPGDSFYVIEHEDEEGDYVVLDGNRRLSALRV